MKGSMDHYLSLHVPKRTLDSEFRASEAVRRRLQSHRSQLLFELNEKDRAIELAKAEASMSARALKRFAEENQKLASECTKLVSESKIMEMECSLYESDQEALMDFANEAQQRAGDAEARVQTLEEKVLLYKRELDSYKEGGISKSKASLEENLLESVLDMLVDKDECSSDGSTSFLETRRGHESCPKLLRMENLLTPATHKILSLAAKVERLLKEKEELRINLQRAEDEGKLLFDDNNYLDEENKMLLRFDHHGIRSGSSGGSNGSSKSNKRKSSRRMYSPIEKRSELNDVDSSRSSS